VSLERDDVQLRPEQTDNLNLTQRLGVQRLVVVVVAAAAAAAAAVRPSTFHGWDRNNLDHKPEG